MRLALAGGGDVLARRLRATLRNDGVAVRRTPSVRKTECDVILVWAGEPGDPRSCAERVRGLRDRQPCVPILAVLARGEAHAVIEALDAGADAVLKEPVDVQELKLRLRGLTRRVRREPRSFIQRGGIRLDRLRHCVRGPAGAVRLTPRECQLLQFLMLNANRVVSREELGKAVWTKEDVPSANTLDVHLYHLRAKLTRAGFAQVIHTIRAIGFRFSAADGSPARTSRTREGTAP